MNLFSELIKRWSPPIGVSRRDAYLWQPANIIGQTCNHPTFEIKLAATIIRFKLTLAANEIKLIAANLQS